MDKLIENSKPYWKEICIMFCVLIIISISYYSKYKINELENQINSTKVQSNIDNINNPLKDVFDREFNKYPKLDNEINALNNTNKKLKQDLQKLEKEKLTKDKAYELFKNKNLEEISFYFTSNGFPNSITKYNTGK